MFLNSEWKSSDFKACLNQIAITLYQANKMEEIEKFFLLLKKLKK